MFPDWMMQTFREVVSEGPFGVEMGFAFDGYFLPEEMVVGLLETAKKAGIKIVTSHYCRGAMLGKSRRSPYLAKRTKESLVDLLESHGLHNTDGPYQQCYLGCI